MYLTSLNIPRWRGIRTLFMHGEKSLVFNPQSATRSAIWLRRSLTPAAGGTATPVRLRRIPDFGHMDVILADGAPGESFSYLRSFLPGRLRQPDSFQVPDGHGADVVDPVLTEVTILSSSSARSPTSAARSSARRASTATSWSCVLDRAAAGRRRDPESGAEPGSARRAARSHVVPAEI